MNIYHLKDTSIIYKLYNQILLSSTSKSNKNTFNLNNENYVFKRNREFRYFQLFINNIKGMFLGCKSLLSLPDISNWNTFNANDIS